MPRYNAEAVGPAILLRAHEAAALLGISRTRVYHLLRTGELEGVKIGNSRLFSRDACERWAAQLAAAEPDSQEPASGKCP
jgi:excisionase family DNA binding protein